MEEKNYYDILGADKDASRSELERLYKQLAKQHHPDRGGDAEEMKVINEAYRVLANESTRRAYDAERNRGADSIIAMTQPAAAPSIALPDTFLARTMLALFNLVGGLTLLFVVTIFYLRFMWPIVVVAIVVVLFGVWRMHEVMLLATKEFSSPAHIASVRVGTGVGILVYCGSRSLSHLSHRSCHLIFAISVLKFRYASVL